MIKLFKSVDHIFDATIVAASCDVELALIIGLHCEAAGGERGAKTDIAIHSLEEVALLVSGFVS